jgi:hypothetical protein
MILAHLRVLYGAAFANLVLAALNKLCASRQQGLRMAT